MTDPHRIVAEVSKTWVGGVSHLPGTLSQNFEAVIEQNKRRGYVLESWQFSQRQISPDQMVETVIAVFIQTL